MKHLPGVGSPPTFFVATMRKILDNNINPVIIIGIDWVMDFIAYKN
jgi:hypothetical protein